MSNKRLDLLIRKNKAKLLSQDYKEMFIKAGFTEVELTYVELERSDEVVEHIKQIFPSVKEQFETLSANSSYINSKLLSSAFSQVSELDECYIFSDDFSYCGMYLAKARLVQANCLNVAKQGYSNTCFIVDKGFKFSFTINYCDEDNFESRYMFDIQLKLISD